MSLSFQAAPAMPFNFQMVRSDLFEGLQHRISELEVQLDRALKSASKKEAYANTLENDLEHIIAQLQRLEVVKK